MTTSTSLMPRLAVRRAPGPDSMFADQSQSRNYIAGDNNGIQKAIKYALRFHFKSGKERDMFISEFNYSGNGSRNELGNAIAIMRTIDKNLEEYGVYYSENKNIASQNFAVVEGEFEFIEIVERD